MVTADDDAPREEYEKEVTMKVYSTETGMTNLYEWASELSDVDLTSMEENLSVEWHAVIDAGRRTFRQRIFGAQHYEDEMDEIRDELSEFDSDKVKVERTVNRNLKPVNNRREAAKDSLRDALQACPDVLHGERELAIGRLRYQDQRDRTSVRFRDVSWETERVLAKEEKREDDDLYETLGEVPCLSFVIEMGSSNKNHISEWTEELIPRLHKEFTRSECVGKVRYSSCTTSEVKSGECYDL